MSTTTKNNAKDAPPVQLPVDLRDYFAAHVIQGLFSADTEECVMPEENKVRIAYHTADLMLKHRSKP